MLGNINLKTGWNVGTPDFQVMEGMGWVGAGQTTVRTDGQNQPLGWRDGAGGSAQGPPTSRGSKPLRELASGVCCRDVGQAPAPESPEERHGAVGGTTQLEGRRSREEAVGGWGGWGQGSAC